MRTPLAKAVTFIAGVIVLCGYFFQYPPLLALRTLLLSWAVPLAGVAMLVGIINLVSVHWQKLVGIRKERDFYSLFLILAFLITFLTGMILTPSSPLFQKAVTAIQAPVETSLMAILSVSLAYAGLRLFQRRRSLMSFVFGISTIIFLVLQGGLFLLFGKTFFFGDFLSILQTIPLAGGRGILLGIALGTIIAGVRILISRDRPYSE